MQHLKSLVGYKQKPYVQILDVLQIVVAQILMKNISCGKQNQTIVHNILEIN